jgi:hypothetical protein
VKMSFALGVSNSALGCYKMNRANPDIDIAIIIGQQANVFIEDWRTTSLHNHRSNPMLLAVNVRLLENKKKT